jgi:CRISPR/Cas system CSM-associated protein Csm3 (group 7 of RAMP superfamily)
MSTRKRNPGGRRGRGVVERVEIRGELVLDTPAHLGGEGEGLTDMPLLRNARDGQTPLLTGTSIAGALRNYLHEYLEGYRQPRTTMEAAARLFGAVDERARASVQSWLLVDDALGDGPGIELRDGVALDAQTRTAKEKKKFDVELLQAGTTFPLSFELLLTADNRELLPLLALVLRGLEGGEIGLGSRKRRGLGRCRVTGWRVRRYDLTTPRGLVAWLDEDATGEESGEKIAPLLQEDLAAFEDQRRVFTLDGDFELISSLLIRSGSGAADDPDMVHLRSYRDGGEAPILSGTSLAGAVRARAQRIANTLHGRETGTDLVDSIFGRHIEDSKDKPTGSRLVTHETKVKGTTNLVHGRVKIDRFTGGAYPQALFFQQPVFGGDDSQVNIQLELRQPKPHEIGLLLLVTKDLWTGDLPLGGESSVGRGRLQGKRATLALKSKGRKVWELTQRADGGLEFGGDGKPQELEDFVTALHRYEEGKGR